LQSEIISGLLPNSLLWQWTANRLLHTLQDQSPSSYNSNRGFIQRNDRINSPSQEFDTDSAQSKSDRESDSGTKEDEEEWGIGNAAVELQCCLQTLSVIDGPSEPTINAPLADEHHQALTAMEEENLLAAAWDCTIALPQSLPGISNIFDLVLPSAPHQENNDEFKFWSILVDAELQDVSERVCFKSHAALIILQIN
jgi:hypothetical protein